jgi:S-adenosylmethionine hydrolase
MEGIRRIALVTDFGGSGPYLGQMKLRLAQLVPEIPVIDLISDLAPFRPDLAAYLLPALVRDMPAATLYLCVVDPGVGGERNALVVEVDGNGFIGPDNGLLGIVARRALDLTVRRVDWRPRNLSASFHGRDLFAPLAAMTCQGKPYAGIQIDLAAIEGSGAPNDLSRIIYADGYGNLMTGVRASLLGRDTQISAAGARLGCARTFCEVPPGTAFWYENALGLVELAVNQGRADEVLGLGAGDPFVVEMA